VFVIALIPVIGIVQVGHQAMADRYAYIPYIGLFVIISWGLGQMATHATTLPRPVLVVAALSVIVALSAVTTQYLQYWQDGTKLFTRAEIVASQPDPTIEEALGDALLSAGRYDEAYQHFGETCLLRPNYAFCHYNMAEILFNRHQLKDALDQYQIAGSLTENKDIGLSCLINSGEILIELGDYETANMRLATVLQIDSNNQTALVLRQRALDLKAQSYGTKNVY
jgi:tetratricopeptide (TPR) repeat protein